MSAEMNKGKEMYDFAAKIFPYLRSLTGDGVRKTLADIDEFISKDGGPHLTIYNVPSGTQAFDWTIPKEWKILEAYIEDEQGNHIIDIKNNNLHVLGYSAPVDKWVELDELKKYLYTQQDQPDLIPYVTSYYKERYGFCMSENMKNSLKPGKYHMYIDSELFDGNLTYADVIFPGKSKKEIMFSTYFCHPSMANNECSGPTVQAELIKYVSGLKDRRYTYRFVFIPETIGSLTYMSQNGRLAEMKKNMVAGFVLSCVGDNRSYGLVETKYAGTMADKVLKNILKFKTNDNYKTYSFKKRGSDERQYGGPNCELPVVAFFRSKYGEYPEYHTSADNMDFVSIEGFQGSYDVVTSIVNTFENNYYYKINTFGDPQLGKRGLYPTISQKGSYDEVLVMMDFITYADGRNDLIDLSNIVYAPTEKLIEIKNKISACGLLDFKENAFEE